jgi:hypothetical protein
MNNTFPARHGNNTHPSRTKINRKPFRSKAFRVTAFTTAGAMVSCRQFPHLPG